MKMPFVGKVWLGGCTLSLLRGGVHFREGLEIGIVEIRNWKLEIGHLDPVAAGERSRQDCRTEGISRRSPWRPPRNDTNLYFPFSILQTNFHSLLFYFLTSRP